MAIVHFKQKAKTKFEFKAKILMKNLKFFRHAHTKRKKKKECLI